MPERGSLVDADRLAVLEDVGQHEDRRVSSHPEVVEEVRPLVAEYFRQGVELLELEPLPANPDQRSSEVAEARGYSPSTGRAFRYSSITSSMIE